MTKVTIVTTRKNVRILKDFLQIPTRQNQPRFIPECLSWLRYFTRLIVIHLKGVFIDVVQAVSNRKCKLILLFKKCMLTLGWQAFLQTAITGLVPKQKALKTPVAKGRRRFSCRSGSVPCFKNALDSRYPSS